MNYNWNWGIFFQTSPDGVHTYLETLLLGTGWTLATALSAWCVALAMGSLAKQTGLPLAEPQNFKATAGKGAFANVDGEAVVCGRASWLQANGVADEIAPCSITPIRNRGKRSNTPSNSIVASVCIGGNGIAM